MTTETPRARVRVRDVMAAGSAGLDSLAPRFETLAQAIEAAALPRDRGADDPVDAAERHAFNDGIEKAASLVRDFAVNGRQTREEPSMSAAILQLRFRGNIATMDKLMKEVARRNAANLVAPAWTLDALCDELMQRAIREFLQPAAKVDA